MLEESTKNLFADSATIPCYAVSGHPQPALLCFGKTQASACDPLSARVHAVWGQAMIPE